MVLRCEPSELLHWQPHVWPQKPLPAVDLTMTLIRLLTESKLRTSSNSNLQGDGRGWLPAAVPAQGAAGSGLCRDLTPVLKSWGPQPQ